MDWTVGRRAQEVGRQWIKLTGNLAKNTAIEHVPPRPCWFNLQLWHVTSPSKSSDCSTQPGWVTVVNFDSKPQHVTSEAQWNHSQLRIFRLVSHLIQHSSLQIETKKSTYLSRHFHAGNVAQCHPLSSSTSINAVRGAACLKTWTFLLLYYVSKHTECRSTFCKRT